MIADTLTNAYTMLDAENFRASPMLAQAMNDLEKVSKDMISLQNSQASYQDALEDVPSA